MLKLNVSYPFSEKEFGFQECRIELGHYGDDR